MFPEQLVDDLTTYGGVKLNELLSKAIPYNSLPPDPDYVCDWTSKDLDRLPADQQKEW